MADLVQAGLIPAILYVSVGFSLLMTPYILFFEAYPLMKSKEDTIERKTIRNKEQASFMWEN